MRLDPFMSGEIDSALGNYTRDRDHPKVELRSICGPADRITPVQKQVTLALDSIAHSSRRVMPETIYLVYYAYCLVSELKLVDIIGRRRFSLGEQEYSEIRDEAMRRYCLGLKKIKGFIVDYTNLSRCR